MDFVIEEEFLGNLILSPNLMKKVVIPEEVFFDIQNRFIFKLIKLQFQDSGTISIPALLTNYKEYFNEKFKASVIVEKTTLLMANSIPIESKFDYYQETLFSRYIRSEILKSIKEFQNQKINTEELLNTIHKYENMSIKTTENKLDYNQIFRIINSKNKNINFKFNVLSKYSNIQEHDLVVIAARTGIGKTAFILNLLEDLSDRYNCILFNMEMSEKQVYQRLVAINTGIPMKYHDKPETDYQKEKILEGCKNIAEKKIKIISSGQTIATIRRKIINESKDEHTIVFIDYVGLISSTDKNQSTYEKVTNIVKELRQISLDYNCTIFLVSQLNRNSEDRADKIPKISDLKESGELEQSATTVLMLYDENHENNKSKQEIEISVVIGKNRNGKVGIIPLIYNKENQKYNNLEKKIKDPNSWRKE